MLLLREDKERNCKGCPLVHFTLYRNKSALPLNYRFCQGQAQPNTLRIKRMSAPVKAFEDMVDILRWDAISIIGYKYAEHRRCALPCDLNDSTRPYMV